MPTPILAIVVGLVLVVAYNFFGAVFSRLDTPTMLAEFLLTLSVCFLRGGAHGFRRVRLMLKCPVLIRRG